MSPFCRESIANVTVVCFPGLLMYVCVVIRLESMFGLRVSLSVVGFINDFVAVTITTVIVVTIIIVIVLIIIVIVVTIIIIILVTIVIVFTITNVFAATIIFSSSSSSLSSSPSPSFYQLPPSSSLELMLTLNFRYLWNLLMLSSSLSSLSIIQVLVVFV